MPGVSCRHHKLVLLWKRTWLRALPRFPSMVSDWYTVLFVLLRIAGHWTLKPTVPVFMSSVCIRSVAIAWFRAVEKIIHWWVSRPESRTQLLPRVHKYILLAEKKHSTLCSIASKPGPGQGQHLTIYSITPSLPSVHNGNASGLKVPVPAPNRLMMMMVMMMMMLMMMKKKNEWW